MSRIGHLLSGLYHSVADKTARDWQVIVGSLILATLLWVANALTKTYTTTLRYPVSWEYDPDRFAVLHPLPNYLQMNVTGKGWRVVRHGYGPRRPPIRFSLGEHTRQDFLSPLELAQVSTPFLSGLQINKVLHDSIRVDLNPLRSYLYKVVVDSATLPIKEGYQLCSPIVVLPSVVKMTAPAALHDTLKRVLRLPVPARNLTRNYEELVQLPADRYPNTKFEPSAVLVGFKVTNLQPARQLVPVTKLNFPPGYRLTRADSLVTVSYAVSPNFASKIKPDSFRIEADFRQLRVNDSILPAKLIYSTSLATSITLHKNEVHANKKKTQ